MKTVQKAGGVVVQRQSGEIAVVTNEFGQHVLPKGGIKPGETSEAAARREVYEETGLKRLELQRKIGILQRPGHASAASKTIDAVKNIHFYLYYTDETKLNPIEEDSLHAAWLKPAGMKQSLAYPEEFTFLAVQCPEVLTTQN